MSVVGANGLNRCLLEFDLRDPAEILNKLSQLVTKTFEKTNSQVKDGMDIALCCIDKNTNELTFSGAYNPLWIIRENAEDSSKLEGFNLIKEGKESITETDQKTLLETMRQFVHDVLGLEENVTHGESTEKLGAVVELLIQMRKEARENRDFATSDQIRDQLAELGIQLKDGKEGTTYSLG